MGIKDLCRSANRGVSLFYTGTLPPLSPPSLLSSLPLQHPKKQEFEYFLVWFGILSGFCETLKRENQQIFSFCCDLSLCLCLFCVAFGALVLLVWLVVVCDPSSIRAKTDKNKLF